MDPVSAVILIGLVTAASLRVAGSAASDTIAAAKGNTPPSLEKWRENQRKKEAAGAAPAAEPSPWRRRWDNAVEKSNAKAAQNHAADMEHLRDHGRDNVNRRKQKLENQRQRRDAVQSKLSGAGAASWQFAKSAAEKTREKVQERRQENDAWDENARRATTGPDGLDTHNDRDTENNELADVLTFRSRHRPDGVVETEVIPGDEDGSQVRGDPNDPSTWRGVDRYGRDIQTGRGTSTDVTKPGGPTSVLHDDDTYLLDENVSPERRIVEQHHNANSGRGQNTPAQHRQAINPEHTVVQDPDAPAGTLVSVAELQRRRAAEEQERQHRHEAAENQADREHAERMAHLQQQIPTQSSPETADTDEPTDIHPTDSEGTIITMTAHSGEITDLASALDYAVSASEYCTSVSGSFENAEAQATASAQELTDQLANLEQAQSSLAERGLDSEADRLAGVAEQFSVAAESLRQAQDAIAAAQENLDSAKGELDASAAEFRSQDAISEELAGHSSVANDTSFYTQSG